MFSIFFTAWWFVSDAEGVRGEVVYEQAMLETGWLQFGGDASAGQFNFSGLGTTGGGVAGNSFPDVRTGIRAQVQHLKAYASSEELTQACVDNRFQYVSRESTPYVFCFFNKGHPQTKTSAGALPSSQETASKRLQRGCKRCLTSNSRVTQAENTCN